MNGRPMAQLIRDWLPASLCAFFVVATALFLLIKQGAAHDDITALKMAADNLNETAVSIHDAAVTPDDSRKLSAARDELDARIAAADKPGLIQEELMKTAKRARLEVREIQAVQPGGKAPPDGSSAPPSYRVSVRGSYSQIAEYLELCKAQRVPARVQSLRITNEAQDGEAAADGRLGAVITVETFRFQNSVAANVKG